MGRTFPALRFNRLSSFDEFPEFRARAFSSGQRADAAFDARFHLYPNLAMGSAGRGLLLAPASIFRS
jgi:hypothetical protein